MRALGLACIVVLSMGASGAAQRTVELPATDRRITSTAETEFSVGREEGAAWEMLSGVSGVGFDGRGNLYVLDGGNARVVVLDARGALLRTVGRRGSGPGELISPVALAVFRSGDLAVADAGRNSVSLFSASGAFARNLPLVDSLGQPTPETAGAVQSMEAATDGLYLFTQARRPRAMSASGTAVVPAEVPIYRIGLTGSEVRVVTHVPRMPAAIRGNASGSGAAVRPVARAFYPQPYRALLHTEAVAVISGTNPGYRVDLLNSDGRPQLTLVRASTPRRVTEQDRNDARNAAFDPACGLRERDRESAGRDPSPSLMLRDVTWARFPRKQLPDAFSTGGRAAYSVMNEDGVETIVERLPPELR